MTPDQIRARKAEGMTHKAIAALYKISLRQVNNALKAFVPSRLNTDTTRLWEQCKEMGGCKAGDVIVWRFTEVYDYIPIPVCSRCEVPMRQLGRGFGRTHNRKRDRVWMAA